MNIYKKLIGNSIIFAIGNLGSKVITFLLVPLYTHYLSTMEYGIVDMVTTTTSLMLPIVSANIFESVLRFAIDKDENKQKVLTNSLLVGSIGSILSILLMPIIGIFITDKKLLFYLIGILVLQVFRSIFSQFARAIGEVKIFAIDGIVMTLITAISNIFFLTILDLGIDGYLLSLILANLFSALYLIISLHIWKYINISTSNVAYSKILLQYSIPMIPNSIMWWLISASNRYFILFFVGASGNGIFAVANKIPGILNIFSTIFSQAWQLSAIEEYGNDNKSNFYTNVFNVYSGVLLVITGVIVTTTKIFMKYFLDEAYYAGWKLIPFLVIGVVFSSFSGFLGANYLASKETKGVFKTSIYGGFISLILNVILIPLLGIMGASISNMLSFFMMFILRYVDTKKMINMHIDFKTMIINTLLILLQTAILFCGFTIINELVLLSVVLMILVYNNKSMLKMIASMVTKNI